MLSQQNRILGKTTVPEIVVDVLPERPDPARLEAPYDRIDSKDLVNRVDCVEPDEAEVLVDRFTQDLVEGVYSEAQVRLILDVVESIEERVCE